MTWPWNPPKNPKKSCAYPPAGYALFTTAGRTTTFPLPQSTQGFYDIATTPHRRVLLSIATLALPAYAKRGQINALSDCIAKADVIVLASVDSKTDVADKGVLTLTIHGLYKGKVDARQLTIADKFFRSDHQKTLEGEIPPEPKKAYFFFLKSVSPTEFVLFDSYDGVIQSNVPVAKEIEKQVGARVR